MTLTLTVTLTLLPRTGGPADCRAYTSTGPPYIAKGRHSEGPAARVRVRHPMADLRYGGPESCSDTCSILKAYKVWAHELITPCMCSATDGLLVSVTPRNGCDASNVCHWQWRLYCHVPSFIDKDNLGIFSWINLSGGASYGAKGLKPPPRFLYKVMLCLNK